MIGYYKQVTECLRQHGFFCFAPEKGRMKSGAMAAWR